MFFSFQSPFCAHMFLLNSGNAWNAEMETENSIQRKTKKRKQKLGPDQITWNGLVLNHWVQACGGPSVGI